MVFVHQMVFGVVFDRLNLGFCPRLHGLVGGRPKSRKRAYPQDFIVCAWVFASGSLRLGTAFPMLLEPSSRGALLGSFKRTSLYDLETGPAEHPLPAFPAAHPQQ